MANVQNQDSDANARLERLEAMVASLVANSKHAGESESRSGKRPLVQSQVTADENNRMVFKKPKTITKSATLSNSTDKTALNIVLKRVTASSSVVIDNPALAGTSTGITDHNRFHELSDSDRDEADDSQSVMADSEMDNLEKSLLSSGDVDDNDDSIEDTSNFDDDDDEDDKNDNHNQVDNNDRSEENNDDGNEDNNESNVPPVPPQSSSASGEDSSDFPIIGSDGVHTWIPPTKAFSWFQKVVDVGISDEQFKAIDKSYSPPEKDAHFFEPPKLPSAVWDAVKPVKTSCWKLKACHKAQAYVTTAIKPLLSVLDSLDRSDDETRKKIANSIQLLSTANLQFNRLRRAIASPLIKKDFRKAILSQPVRHNSMFGEDFAKTTETAVKDSKAYSKIFVGKSSFRNWGSKGSDSSGKSSSYNSQSNKSSPSGRYDPGYDPTPNKSNRGRGRGNGRGRSKYGSKS